MNLYVCGAFFLLFFVVPAVGLFFAARGADQDPNDREAE
jgi:hypothetical protein